MNLDIIYCRYCKYIFMEKSLYESHKEDCLIIHEVMEPIVHDLFMGIRRYFP